MLNSYLQQVQRFLRDQNQVLLNPDDLREYVNRARREVAMRTQSIRVLSPISGSVKSATLTAGGTGYTAPVVTISLPDAPDGFGQFPLGSQATATATVVAGVITNVAITYGGSGYWQPTITITDPTGSGAVVSLLVTPVNQTINGQEVFSFSDIDLSRFPGVGPIFAIKSVSILFDNYRYSLPNYAFSVYQAHIRQYPYQYSYVPTCFAQYGQGVNGTLYLYPVASQNYQIEVDCFCLPIDLNTDGDVEAIPQPWQDAVPYFAAHLAYLELQNLNAAKFYLDLYDNMVHRYSGYARPGIVTNPYGRY